jgi:hypothetical protein
MGGKVSLPDYNVKSKDNWKKKKETAPAVVTVKIPSKG